MARPAAGLGLCGERARGIDRRATYAALGWAEAFEKVEPAIERYKLSLVDFKKNAFGKRALSSEAEAAVRHRWRAWFEDLGYE